ncbi:MAG: insulinase family protein, partial [Proteobacteria bacterium]|nr:insulinase family protein [Pseudomonadota bacterium]
SLIQLINKYEREQIRLASDYKAKTINMLYYSMLNSRLDEISRGANPPFITGFAFTSSYAKAVNFSTLGALAPDGEIETGLKTLLTEAERAYRHGFTDGELDRAKKELSSLVENYYSERDNRESIVLATEYVDAFLNGLPVPSVEYEYIQYNKVLPEITLDDIKKSSEKLLKSENRVVLVTSPRKEDFPLPEETDLQSVLDSVNTADIKPYIDDFKSEELLSKIPESSPVIKREVYENTGITEWTLANGIKVVLKPTDFKKDEILFTSYSNGGTSIAGDDDYVSSIFSTSVLSVCGAGEFSTVELEKQLAGKQVSVNPYISDLKEGFAGSARPSDFETMLQLLYLTATEPRNDQTAWDSFIQRVGDSIKNRDSDPGQRYNDLLNNTLTSNHFRARPLTTELLKEVDLDRSLTFYKERFKDFSDYTFIFTGSFSPEEIEPLITTYIGGLPATGRDESWIDRDIRYPEGIISESVTAGIEPLSKVSLIYSGD